ncbi:type III pantothenate kinase [Thiomicrorhabdus aquaedulcis]|uniref:type III pantothenate kinase n=1 Tax=Thiomicrorhabdus aquaedulcis TaxID=2211106 RepID=UPI000FDAF446|nr:type III pantothenate kinase [Thiomicrorhabdus aquaedulcis]
MDKLFLDVGNSRVKAAVVSGGDYYYIGAYDLNGFLNDRSSFTDLKTALLSGGFDNITEVFISSVTSIDVLEEIKTAILEMWGVFAIVFTSQQSCCNLTSGYDVFHQLGVDRWMALQGGLQLCNEPFIVVDAGTAMTVDAVVDGQHLGGFIVPGLTSLRSALVKDASALALVSVSMSDSSSDALYADNLLATNTESAVLGGTLYMSAAFINRFVEDLNQQVGTYFKVFLTGGDAAVLQPLIDVKTDKIFDLVLKGMVSIQKLKKS